MTLHQQLKIALAIKGSSITAFAQEHGVHPSAIYRVCEGSLPSERLSTAINSYIDDANKTFQQLNAEGKLARSVA